MLFATGFMSTAATTSYDTPLSTQHYCHVQLIHIKTQSLHVHYQQLLILVHTVLHLSTDQHVKQSFNG